jgi:hypothetical protein
MRNVGWLAGCSFIANRPKYVPPSWAQIRGKRNWARKCSGPKRVIHMHEERARERYRERRWRQAHTPAPDRTYIHSLAVSPEGAAGKRGHRARAPLSCLLICRVAHGKFARRRARSSLLFWRSASHARANCRGRVAPASAPSLRRPDRRRRSRTPAGCSFRINSCKC